MMKNEKIPWNLYINESLNNLNKTMINNTLYLYKKLENLIHKSNIVNESFSNEFLQKILQLPNNLLEETIVLLQKWEEEIFETRYNYRLKKLVYEITFIKKTKLQKKG